MAALFALFVFMYCLYVLATVAQRRVRVRRYETVPGICTTCGYSLEGLHAHPRCPECGSVQADVKEVECVEFVLERERIAWFLACVTCVVMAAYFGPHIYEWHVSKRQRWPLCQDLASEMGVLILLGVFELLVYWHIGVVRLEMASARRAAKAFMMAMGAGMVVGLSVSLFASDEHSATWEMLFADTIAVFAVLAYAMGLGLRLFGSERNETWAVDPGERGTTASTAGEGTTEG